MSAWSKIGDTSLNLWYNSWDQICFFFEWVHFSNFSIGGEGLKFLWFGFFVCLDLEFGRSHEGISKIKKKSIEELRNLSAIRRFTFLWAFFELRCRCVKFGIKVYLPDIENFLSSLNSRVSLICPTESRSRACDICVLWYWLIGGWKDWGPLQ